MIFLLTKLGLGRGVAQLLGWAIPILLVFGLLVLTHWWTYTAGKEKVFSQLKDDRIQIFIDGRKIDADVLEKSATDDGLCTLLGGCESDSVQPIQPLREGETQGSVN